MACLARGARRLAALAPSHPYLCRVRSLESNKLGPEAGMALTEVLKSNTTLKGLGSAALPSNTLAQCLSPPWHACPRHSPLLTHPLPCAQPLQQRARPRGWHCARRGAQEQHDPRRARVCCPAIGPTPAHAFSPHSLHPRCTRPFSPFLRRVRSLNRNELGPKGGMALAEALKSNTALKYLGSAALPSNPPAHTISPHSMHPQCTCPFLRFLLPCAQARVQRARPRGWHGARQGPQEQHHPRVPQVCCLAIEPTYPCNKVLRSPH